MKLVTKTTIVTVAEVPIVLLLLMSATSNNVYAWDGGYEGGPWSGGGGGLGHLLSLFGGGNGGGLGCCSGGGGGGYYAGQQDAIYDHDNNLAYNPIGECLSCHSELYWQNFHQGYDHQWNSYQNQESTQGTTINIYGNNNYVNTNQYSSQNQQGPGSEPNSDFNPSSPNCLGSSC